MMLLRVVMPKSVTKPTMAPMLRPRSSAPRRRAKCNARMPPTRAKGRLRRTRRGLRGGEAGRGERENGGEEGEREIEQDEEEVAGRAEDQREEQENSDGSEAGVEEDFTMGLLGLFGGAREFDVVAARKVYFGGDRGAGGGDEGLDVASRIAGDGLAAASFFV